MAYDGKRNQYHKDFRTAQLPAGYLAEGYYLVRNDEKIMRKEYIIEFPEAIANTLSNREETKNGKKNKRSQIRKFYEYSLRIQNVMKRKNGNFEMVEADLKWLVPAVKYAQTRDVVSDLFVRFVEKNIAAIHNKDDLKAFVKHFEAIVAYLPKEKN